MQLLFVGGDVNVAVMPMCFVRYFYDLLVCSVTVKIHAFTMKLKVSFLLCPKTSLYSYIPEASDAMLLFQEWISYFEYYILFLNTFNYQVDYLHINCN